ncbi:MAG: hypothetical protein K2X93_14565 [Candidatus Obscuribacterales bacterium]|nr:hypothetical protein [Candidatus Obscuribacterales bacterium]
MPKFSNNIVMPAAAAPISGDSITLRANGSIGSESAAIRFDSGLISAAAEAGTPTFYSNGGIKYRDQSSTSSQPSNTQVKEAGNLSGAVTTKFFSPLESRLFVNPMLNLNLLPVAGAIRLAPHETIPDSDSGDDSAGE